MYKYPDSGQILNPYLETNSTSYNICFTRLQNLDIFLAHCMNGCMVLYLAVMWALFVQKIYRISTQIQARSWTPIWKTNFTSYNTSFMRLQNLARFLAHCMNRYMVLYLAVMWALFVHNMYHISIHIQARPWTPIWKLTPPHKTFVSYGYKIWPYFWHIV